MKRSLPGVAAILMLVATAAADDTPYLYSIPAERFAGESGKLDTIIRATLHVQDATAAADLIKEGGALQIVATGEGLVTVEFGERQTLGGDPGSQHLADSFVIDYREPAVVDVSERLRQNLGVDVATTDLTAFVHRYIDDKTYLSSFDLASKVAATRTGDCTEHAVLLTALARANGAAARLALGVVLIETASDVAAFGHAWAEIHSGDSWQIADATMLVDDDTILSVRYLPLMSLDDEGPGYFMDMARLIRIQPSRLSGITDRVSARGPDRADADPGPRTNPMSPDADKRH